MVSQLSHMINKNPSDVHLMSLKKRVVHIELLKETSNIFNGLRECNDMSNFVYKNYRNKIKKYSYIQEISGWHYNLQDYSKISNEKEQLERQILRLQSDNDKMAQKIITYVEQNSTKTGWLW